MHRGIGTTQTHNELLPTFPPHVSIPNARVLKASITLFHHQATPLFHETNQQSLELHKHHMFIDRISQSDDKNIQQQPLQQTLKLLHLLSEGKWKHIGHPEMVLNLNDF